MNLTHVFQHLTRRLDRIEHKLNEKVKKEKAGNLTEVNKQLTQIRKALKKVMATQEEAAAQLAAANASLTKIGAETQTLLDKVAVLEAAAGNATEVSPALQAAIDGVVAQAQAVDDLVPDAVAAKRKR